MALPRFVGLKSNYNNKYLRYLNEDGEMHGFLQFSGEEVVTPYTKYEIEMAKSGNGLVHIRCCYNNKYWARWSQNHHWILANANEPEEDKSKWSCTLFQPVFLDNANKSVLRFRHVQLGHYACLFRSEDNFKSCLYAGWEAPNNDLCDVCTIIDWESMLILPKRVVFKGENGKYLSGRLIEGHPYLQFASNDIDDPTVGYEVFITPDGSIRIKSDQFGKFWRRNSNWIWADSDDTSDNSKNTADTLFWPTKVANEVVALRNLGNNNYCKRFTTGNITSGLSANVSNIPIYAHLEVKEPVSARNISNVSYHLKDARIYNQSVVTLVEGKAINKNQQPITVDFKLYYPDTKSSTWNSTVSLKFGVKINIQTGIPVIQFENIQVTGEFNGEYEWGKTVVSTTVVETVYKVTLPPMTTVNVSLLATTASFDIPFSYTQRDTLTNGNTITYTMDDGLYTGINTYNLKYEVTEEKM